MPEKPESSHGETQVSSVDLKHTPVPAQDDTNTDEEPRKTNLRRVSTLQDLERGLRHIWQGSHIQHGSSYATSVRRVFSRILGDPAISKRKYSLRQAYFIVAGGLAIETKSFHEQQYLTVTVGGLRVSISLSRIFPKYRAVRRGFVLTIPDLV